MLGTLEGTDRCTCAGALVRATDGFVIDWQNAESVRVFGSLAGTPWLSLPGASTETLRGGYATIEEALDTGKLVSNVSESDAGWGRYTAHRLPRGMVMTTWHPVRSPIIVPTLDLRRLALEHLDRLEWALRSGRPAPHLPAALRVARPAALGSTPVPGARREAR